MHDDTLGYAIAAAILVIAAVLFYKSKAGQASKFDTNLSRVEIPPGKMFVYTIVPATLVSKFWGIQDFTFQTSDSNSENAVAGVYPNIKNPAVFTLSLNAAYYKEGIEIEANPLISYPGFSMQGRLKNVSKTSGTGSIDFEGHTYNFRWKRSTRPIPKSKPDWGP